MKDLEMIGDATCPECGSGTRSESREGQHTNSYRREFRTFECGKRLEFFPNYMRVIDSDNYICTHSDSYKKDEQKLEEFKREILKLGKRSLSKKHHKRLFRNIVTYW